jgi:hypothetical protein
VGSKKHSQNEKDSNETVLIIAEVVEPVDLMRIVLSGSGKIRMPKSKIRAPMPAVEAWRSL